MSYNISKAVNLNTPIQGTLNGSYINVDILPETIKILINNPKYVVLVRESTNTTTSGGGRTTGTMWYNNQILGFTVEDAVRSKKIQHKTAIPDTIEDPSKFNGIPSNVYNIIVSTYTGKDFIRQSFYKGTGMRVSSKSDPTGGLIQEADVFTSDTFVPDSKTAFDGVFIHHGTSEGSSSGCVIFSRTRKSDNTLANDIPGVQNLNKFLQENLIIGPGITQQFIIVNLWEFPEPAPTTETKATVVDDTNNKPVENVNVQN